MSTAVSLSLIPRRTCTCSRFICHALGLPSMHLLCLVGLFRACFFAINDFVTRLPSALLSFQEELCAETTTTLPILPNFEGLPSSADALAWCAVAGNTANVSLYTSGAWGWCNCSDPKALRRYGTTHLCVVNAFFATRAVSPQTIVIIAAAFLAA